MLDSHAYRLWRLYSFRAPLRLQTFFSGHSLTSPQCQAVICRELNLFVPKDWHELTVLTWLSILGSTTIKTVNISCDAKIKMWPHAADSGINDMKKKIFMIYVYACVCVNSPSCSTFMVHLFVNWNSIHVGDNWQQLIKTYTIIPYSP